MEIFSLLLLPLFLFFLSPLPSSSESTILLRANATIRSTPLGTFEMGFFNPNEQQLSNWYLGIWYASFPTRTYIWVANRRIPLKDRPSAALSLSSDGRLSLSDAVNFVVWRSDNNPSSASSADNRLSLLDSGNLVLLSSSGDVVWQSFDYPTDTWLPRVNLTAERYLTSWKSAWDPSPGRYSLRLRAPEYGEIELVYHPLDLNFLSPLSTLILDLKYGVFFLEEWVDFLSNKG